MKPLHIRKLRRALNPSGWKTGFLNGPSPGHEETKNGRSTPPPEARPPRRTVFQPNEIGERRGRAGAADVDAFEEDRVWRCLTPRRASGVNRVGVCCLGAREESDHAASARVEGSSCCLDAR